MNNYDHSISTVFIHYIALGFIVMPDAEARPTFLEDIIRFYGQNDTFSVESLENILGLMKKGRGTYDLKDDQNSLVNSKCLSATEVLSQYDLINHTELSVEHLQHICPALLHQGVLSACPDSVPHKRVDYKVWGYAFLAVTVINLSSLMGLLLTPFTAKPCFPKLLTYFMGLAIGTLFSNAVLQLIPEALGFDPKADDYILKAIGIFGGFYLLFITERMLKLVLKTNQEHGQSHFGTTQQTPATPLPKVDVTARGEVSVVCSAVSIDSLASSRASIISDAPAQQEVQVSNGHCCWLRGPPMHKIKTVAWMISLSDAIHNFIDGLVIGASFTVSVLTGFSSSIAIICEEFPHELGDFVILLNAGMSIPQAVFFNMLSAMSCYVGLVLGVLVGGSFAPNVIFAVAGGMFLYISLADMFPEMNSILKEQEGSTSNALLFFLIQNVGLLSGFSIILLITMFAGDISLG
nr:zinc transporter ZIP8 [Paramormyrops kingsleyae]